MTDCLYVEEELRKKLKNKDELMYRGIDAGFKDVELIPLHVVEYYKTKEDLYALLVKTPFLDDFSEEYERKTIENEKI